MTGGPNAGTYFVHPDHLGSLNVLTTSSGLEVQRLRYIPFGETHSNVGSVDFDRYRYTGQEEDPETGLYYYNARYYDPSLGRFLSPDSIVPQPGDSQAYNRYSYVRNNPVNLIDPSGHGWLSKTWNKVRNYIRRHQTLATIIGVGLQLGTFGTPGFLPGSALLTQTKAGRQILIQEGILAASILTGGAVGWLAEGGLLGLGYAAGSAQLGGYLAGAFAGGFTAGAIQAGLTGGNIWLSGLTAGAIAFGTAALLYAGAYAWQSLQSPALADAGGPGHSPSNRHYVTDGGLRGPDAAFENPTGGELRGIDARGSGSYMAPRDFGARTHAGIDITSQAGQEVVAPFSGTAGVDPSGGVQITGGPYTGRLLYVEPNFTGQIPVQAGTPIGTALDITPIYRGITNHVHFELYLRGVGNVDPTPFIFPTR